MESIVKVQKTETGIRIDISRRDLINLAKSDPECPLKVVDDKLFIDDVISQLQDYATGNAVELGCSNLEYLMGECVAEVGVMCSASVEEIEIE